MALLCQLAGQLTATATTTTTTQIMPAEQKAKEAAVVEGEADEEEEEKKKKEAERTNKMAEKTDDRVSRRVRRSLTRLAQIKPKI